MVKTKMIELFEIKHPIMLAGMNWITEPEVGPGAKENKELHRPAAH